MTESREPRAAATIVSRRADPKRVGPLAGWAWRDARCAMQFGKRQGAWAVDFRADRVRFFLQDASSRWADQAAKMGGVKRRVKPPPASAGGEAPPRRADDKALGESKDTLSLRKQKSLLRLQEFQRRKVLRLRWRHILHKFARRWRHERMWQVHNEWYAARTALAETAGPPAPETERMDEEPQLDASAAPAAAANGPRVGAPGALDAAAPEFSPGLPMAEVERAWAAAFGFNARAEAAVPGPGG